MTHPQTLEDICRLFQSAIADGDLDAALRVYDSDAVFVRRDGMVTSGLAALREELAPLAAMKTRFDFEIKQIAQTGDIALMHTAWTVSEPEATKVHAIEVARRQVDGSWRWLIGDPHTIAREAGS